MIKRVTKCPLLRYYRYVHGSALLIFLSVLLTIKFLIVNCAPTVLAYSASHSVNFADINNLASNCWIFSLMVSCTLHPDSQHRQTVTTKATSRTSMRFYLKKVRTCTACTPMQRSTSLQQRPIICFAPCLRCSLETLPQEQD